MSDGKVRVDGNGTPIGMGDIVSVRRGYLNAAPFGVKPGARAWVRGFPGHNQVLVEFVEEGVSGHRGDGTILSERGWYFDMGDIEFGEGGNMEIRDCDGTELRVGDAVKVRLSALAEYECIGRTVGNRVGTLRDQVTFVDGKETLLGVEFEDMIGDFNRVWMGEGRGYYFPVKHIRKVPLVSVETVQDCDGTSIWLGDEVYVRQSSLGKYSMSKRDSTGKFLGVDEKTGMYIVYFPTTDYKFPFPAAEIRVA